MLGPVSVTLACVLVHWLKEEPVPHPSLRLRTDDLAVSGVAVVSPGGRSWTLVTATFAHAGRPHIVNNLAMLWVVAPTLVTLFGDTLFVALFVVIGCAGWAATLLFSRLARAEYWKIGVAQFATSLGSSPATYGLVMLATVVCNEHGVGRALGMPPWAWFSCVVFGPKFCGDKYGINVVRWGWPRPRAWAALVVALATAWLLMPALVGPAPTASFFMAVYLLNCVVFAAVGRVLWSQPLTGADNACHLGGAVAGLLFGWWWTGTCCGGDAAMWLSLAYLALRVLNDVGEFVR